MTNTARREIKVIPLSVVKRLEDSGYARLASGDATKANSDYFMVFERIAGDGRDMCIVCPSFLRGPLGISASGKSISY